MQGEAEGPSRGCPVGAKCPREAKASQHFQAPILRLEKRTEFKYASEAGFLTFFYFILNTAEHVLNFQLWRFRGFIQSNKCVILGSVL